MSIQLVEPIINALVLRLQEDLPGVIDMVNAESDGEVTISVADLKILDYIPTPSELNHFPTVAVAEGAAGFEDDVGYGATGVYDLNIMLFCLNADQRRLNLELRRLRRAVTIATLRDRQFGPAWGVTLIGFAPGPTLGRGDPKDWMSYTTVSIRCKSEEDS